MKTYKNRMKKTTNSSKTYRLKKNGNILNI